MTLFTDENMRLVLGRLCSPKCALGEAMRAIGGHPSTIWEWFQRDPPLMIRWPDEAAPPITFRDACVIARKIQILNWESAVRSDAAMGIETLALDNHGHVIYREREDMVAEGASEMDPDERYLIWGQRDMFERDADGKRVPMTTRTPIPAHITLKLLSSLLPTTYGVKSEVSVAISAGVRILGDKPVARVVEHIAEQQQAITEAEEAEFSEPDAAPEPARIAPPRGIDINRMPDPTRGTKMC